MRLGQVYESIESNVSTQKINKSPTSLLNIKLTRARQVIAIMIDQMKNYRYNRFTGITQRQPTANDGGSFSPDNEAASATIIYPLKTTMIDGRRPRAVRFCPEALNILRIKQK